MFLVNLSDEQAYGWQNGSARRADQAVTDVSGELGSTQIFRECESAGIDQDPVISPVVTNHGGEY
jgi:hypothetical protein